MIFFLDNGKIMYYIGYADVEKINLFILSAHVEIV